MRPRRQAMSAKERLDGQYNIRGSGDNEAQHTDVVLRPDTVLLEAIKKF
jgi:hypothetical protein